MSVSLSWYEIPRPHYYFHSLASFRAYVTDMHAKVKTIFTLPPSFTKLYVSKVKIMFFDVLTEEKKPFSKVAIWIFFSVSKSYPFNEVN